MIRNINPDIVYCQLIRTALFVRNIDFPHKVIDYQDAFSHGTRQRLKNAPFLLKWLFKREIGLVEKFEEKSFDWFNSHFIISQQDRDWLQVSNKDKVNILPNGIDTEFFKSRSVEKKFEITFTGNMQYPPNVDGAVFLVNEIMPLVWKKYPDVSVQIGGADPDSKVRALKSSKVKVTGWVDDIRDCYDNSKIFIAPMRMGTGLQNKLLEAMSMQIPCVTTSLSCIPLGAQKEVNILTGDSAIELAEQLIRLLENEDERNRIGIAGRRFVQEKYSMDHSSKLLINEFQSLLNTGGLNKRKP